MEPRRIGAVDGHPKMAECASLFRPTLAGAYSPMGDRWYPFELDLLTGIATDAIYPLEMATAARIK